MTNHRKEPRRGPSGNRWEQDRRRGTSGEHGWLDRRTNHSEEPRGPKQEDQPQQRTKAGSIGQPMARQEDQGGPGTKGREPRGTTGVRNRRTIHSGESRRGPSGNQGGRNRRTSHSGETWRGEPSGAGTRREEQPKQGTNVGKLGEPRGAKREDKTTAGNQGGEHLETNGGRCRRTNHSGERRQGTLGNQGGAKQEDQPQRGTKAGNQGEARGRVRRTSCSGEIRRPRTSFIAEWKSYILDRLVGFSLFLIAFPMRGILNSVLDNTFFVLYGPTYTQQLFLTHLTLWCFQGSITGTRFYINRGSDTSFVPNVMFFFQAIIP